MGKPLDNGILVRKVMRRGRALSTWPIAVGKSGASISYKVEIRFNMYVSRW